MTTELGIDYAWARPRPSAIIKYRAICKDGVERNVSFVMRYLCYLPNGKGVTRSEIDALHSVGLDVGFVWEQGAGDAKYGYERGLAHGNAAKGYARSLGVPSGIVIYFAVDWDVTPGEQAIVNAYLMGARDGLTGSGYSAGIYAGYWPLMRALDARVVKYGWQTYAWSGGNRDSRRTVYQFKNGVMVDSGDCDLNERYDRVGFWYSGQTSPVTGGNETMDPALWDLYSAISDGITREGFVSETAPDNLKYHEPQINLNLRVLMNQFTRVFEEHAELIAEVRGIKTDLAAARTEIAALSSKIDAVSVPATELEAVKTAVRTAFGDLARVIATAVNSA